MYLADDITVVSDSGRNSQLADYCENTIRVRRQKLRNCGATPALRTIVRRPVLAGIDHRPVTLCSARCQALSSLLKIKVKEGHTPEEV